MYFVGRKKSRGCVILCPELTNVRECYFTSKVSQICLCNTKELNSKTTELKWVEFWQSSLVEMILLLLEWPVARTANWLYMYTDRGGADKCSSAEYSAKCSIGQLLTGKVLHPDIRWPIWLRLTTKWSYSSKETLLRQKMQQQEWKI